MMDGWDQLHGDHYYRKLEIYPNCFSGLDFQKLKLFGCPSGGPIATIRDDSKILLVKDPDLAPSIDFFTSSGTLLSTFKPKFYKNLVNNGMGWDTQERMTFILEDGTVMLYSVLGQLLYKFYLDGDCKEPGIIDAVIWETGFVVLTKNLQLYAVWDLDNLGAESLELLKFSTPGVTSAGSFGMSRSKGPEIVKLKSELTAEPESWTVVKPQQSRSGEVEVYVATKSGTIFVITKNKCQDMLLTNKGPFSRLSLSPNGKMLACFSTTGIVWVIKSDFTRDLSQFETRSPRPPKQLVWCGSDAVLCYWDSTPEEHFLFLVGPEARYIKYSYSTPVFLITEVDGLRVVSKKGCEFLQRVPNVTTAIFKIGSTAPAALLVSAVEYFERDDPRADSNVRDIKSQNQLPYSVDACVEAAGYEFDVKLQSHLLKAASFGKSFLTSLSYDPFHFVEMSKLLRVLNAIRHPDIGMPLTFAQYTKLSPQRLVDRLINRHRHMMASEISVHLGLRSEDGKIEMQSKVLVHWAKVRVAGARDISDALLVLQIQERLKGITGIDYADIAQEAFNAKRAELATLLLESEPQAHKQIPLLLKMEKLDRALSKALQSGDPNLIDMVLKFLRDRGLAEFYTFLLKYPDAYSIWTATQTEANPKVMEQFYTDETKKEKDETRKHNIGVRLAIIKVTEAYNSTNEEVKHEALAKAGVAFSNCDDKFSFKITGEELDLLKEQLVFEKKLAHPFVGLSLIETVHKCITHGADGMANELKSKFKISTKRFAWTKIRALAEVKQWEQLRKYSANSGLGSYRPFAEVCIQHNNKQEAMEYIKKLENMSERAILYGRADAWEEALALVDKLKDPLDTLWKLKALCTNPQVMQVISQTIQRQQ